MLPALTIDIGTTSVKLSVFDAEGIQRASASRATPTVRDGSGEIYDLDALVASIGDFVRGLDAAQRDRLQQIAITGVGESGGLVRPDLTLASPMILWHDQRGAPILAALSDDARARIAHLTGLPTSANYGLSKIVWAVREAGEDGRGAQWLNVAEYLCALLTGVRRAELSLASRTMALDVSTRGWSEEICDLVGLDPRVLPDLGAAQDGFVIDPERARGLGLPRGIAVHVAGHDHMVGAIGADLAPGELLNSTGTTEGLLVLRDRPALDDASARSLLANGLACAGDDYTLFASIPTGGSAFQTLTTLTGLPDEQLVLRIRDAHDSYLAGAIDLDRLPLVLPRFRGSPPPTKNPADRGLIAGIATDTTRDELIVGTFLGLALQFIEVLELFPEAPERIKVIGPAARNPLWLQLKADLLGVTLSIAGVTEVVSRGAQALASGVRPTWDDCSPRELRPDPERHARLLQWREAVGPRWAHLKATPS